MELRDYVSYDALGLAELIAKREVTGAEVVSASLRAVERVNSAINAVVETWPDEVPVSLRDQKDGGLFAGVPFLVKDLGITRAGRSTELGSRLAKGLVAASDSTLMIQFRGAGLVPIGRTTTPEFAISSTTEGVATGVTRNPWALDRSAGGSSGGSGAAVAAGIVPFAHATDGGGSIRVPASVNGLFGLKPSRGRVSNGPAVDEVWSGLAVQLGVSRTVRDSAALLDAVQGGGVGEPYYTAPPKTSFRTRVEQDPGRLRIGFMPNPLNGDRTSAPVAAALGGVAQLCDQLGHNVEDVTLDIGVSWEAFVYANTQLFTVNTTAWINAISAAMGRGATVDYLEPATMAVYTYGRQVSGLDLLDALDVRNMVTRAIGAYFETYDILLTPTVPQLPPLIGTFNQGQSDLDAAGWVDKVFNMSPFTAMANVSGIPAMSVPLSTDPVAGLPVGSQFFAGFGREGLLFSLAGQLERAQPWRNRRATIWAGA
jgi:amidase